MNLDFNTLRKEYEYFNYESYSYHQSGDVVTVEFNFNISDKFFFKPSFSFKNMDGRFNQKIGTTEFEMMLFHIGLIEAISYWKCTCSPRFNILPYTLSEDQINWLQKLIYLGLGEFRYLNGIELTKEDFVSIHSTGPDFAPISFNVDGGNLIPLGGGKDSVVTLEMKSKLYNNDFKVFLLSPRGASLEICNQFMKPDDFFIIDRKLDTGMLELNARGFLNGHTPFSALLSFYSILTAYLLDCKHIQLSNENSANEPTIIGTDINHQYSKSLEYENDLRWYVETYFDNSINYLSFLRPLDELHIANIFSKLKSYHPYFKSCNVGSKQNIWCNNCSKCLFTFIILSPFLSLEELMAIFGENLFDKQELRQYFLELTGSSDTKPFECVGTIDEVNIALKMFLEKHDGRTFKLLEDFDVADYGAYDYTNFSSEHNLSETEFDFLKNELKSINE